MKKLLILLGLLVLGLFVVAGCTTGEAVKFKSTKDLTKPVAEKKICAPITNEKKCGVKDSNLSYLSVSQTKDCKVTEVVLETCSPASDLGGRYCTNALGCCKQKQPNNKVESKCEGNTLVKTISCNNEVVDNPKINCAEDLNKAGKGKTCVENKWCASNCNWGEMAYSCAWGGKYYKLECALNTTSGIGEWLGTDGSSALEECPAGATCYNPEGKCK